MTLYAGTLTTPTEVGSQAITGLDFTPVAVIVLATGSANQTWDTVGMHNILGFSAGPGHDYCVTEHYNNHGASAQARHLIALTEYGTAVLTAYADVESFEAGGFTLTWGAVDGVERPISFLALGGQMQAAVVEWASPLTTGEQAITGVGFPPDLVFTIGSQIDSGDFSVNTPGLFAYGAIDSGIDQFAAGYCHRNDTLVALSSLVTQSANRAALLFKTTTPITRGLRGTGVSLDADGWTTDYAVANDASVGMASLCLAGMGVKVGSFLKSADVGVQTITGLPFQPGAVLLFGCQSEPITPDTYDVGGQDFVGHLHLGLNTAAVHHSCVATSDNSKNNGSYRDEALAYLYIPDDDTIVVAQADTLTPTADGFSLDWTVNDGTAIEILYLAIEAPAALTTPLELWGMGQRELLAAPGAGGGGGRGGGGSAAGGGKPGIRLVRIQSRVAQLPSIVDDLAGGVGYLKARAFLGPPWLSADDDAWWDWTALEEGAAYEPLTAIPATTVAVAVTAVATTVTLTDASSWPDAGHVWLGPGATGEGWGHATYTGKTGNQLTGLVRDTVDAEYTGVHTAGAAARFWWELDTLVGELSLNETLDDALCLVDYAGELGGLLMPRPILRKGSLLLLQVAEYDAGTGDFAAWENALLAWLDSDSARDDADRERPWTAAVASAGGMLANIQSGGLRVGATDLADSGQAAASSVLSPTYKDDSGEFIGEADVGPQSAIDGKLSTLWVADVYTGEDNPVTDKDPADPDGRAGIMAISQVHVASYPGQGAGYRWFEITAPLGLAVDDNSVLINDDYLILFKDSPAWPGLEDDESLLLVENQALFQEENPSYGGKLFDLDAVNLISLNNNKQSVDLAGATAGTFTLTFGGIGPTGAIAYDATATAVKAALVAAGVAAADVYVTGAAGGAWLVTFIGSYRSASQTTMTIDATNLTGGTPAVSVVQGGGGWFVTADKGWKLFDYLSAERGGIMWGPGGQPGDWPYLDGGVCWGDFTFAADANAWVGDPLPAMTPGQTARRIYTPAGTPTTSAEYWEVGTIATPGYVVLATDFEWHLTTFKPISLVLASDITDSSPGASEALSFENGGQPAAEGLYETGVVQIGNEQISYEARDFSAGTVTVVSRAYGGTTAAAHAAGDTVYVVESTVASDAHAVDSVSVQRGDGQPVLEDFILRTSIYRKPRRPGDDNYTDDWTTIATVTGNALATYTVALSPSQRVRHLLVEITKMADGPSRPRINEINATVDALTLDATTILSDATSAEAMTALLTAAGFPAAGIIDDGDTPLVDGYTTEPGLLLPILADMADRDGVRVELRRDGKVRIRKDPFWGVAGLPAEEGELTRADVAYLESNRASGRAVGQVELVWRPPDSDDESTVFYPAAPDLFGETVTVGTYVYADETAAQAGAQKRYYQLRRPYDNVAELAVYGRDYRPGQCWGVAWDWHDESLQEDRTYLIRAASHTIREFGWLTVITNTQITREDER